MSKGLDIAKSSLKKWTGKEGEKLVLLEGNFNARTGKNGGGYEREECELRIRRSKDEKVNGEGRKLIEFVEENGWGIFNGCKEEIRKGNTYSQGGREIQ